VVAEGDGVFPRDEHLRQRAIAHLGRVVDEGAPDVDGDGKWGEQKGRELDRPPLAGRAAGRRVARLLGEGRVVQRDRSGANRHHRISDDLQHRQVI
jgi:hypothetical protein